MCLGATSKSTLQQQLEALRCRGPGACDAGLQKPAATLRFDWTCLLHCRGQVLAGMGEYELDHLLQQSLADTPNQAGGYDVPAPNALRGAGANASEVACSRFSLKCQGSLLNMSGRLCCLPTPLPFAGQCLPASALSVS